jgi:hypothetical protein
MSSGTLQRYRAYLTVQSKGTAPSEPSTASAWTVCNA